MDVSPNGVPRALKAPAGSGSTLPESFTTRAGPLFTLLSLTVLEKLLHYVVTEHVRHQIQDARMHLAERCVHVLRTDPLQFLQPNAGE